MTGIPGQFMRRKNWAGGAMDAKAVDEEFRSLRRGLSQNFLVPGRTDGSVVSAGFVGEWMQSNNSTQVNFPANGTWGDNLSILLTPGEWDISIIMNVFANGATMTRAQCGIGTITGNNTTGLVSGDNMADSALPVNTVRAAFACVPNWRAAPTASTSYFLKVESDYTAGNPQYTARISARRMG